MSRNSMGDASRANEIRSMSSGIILLVPRRIPEAFRLAKTELSLENHSKFSSRMPSVMIGCSSHVDDVREYFSSSSSRQHGDLP